MSENKKEPKFDMSKLKCPQCQRRKFRFRTSRDNFICEFCGNEFTLKEALEEVKGEK